MEAAFDEWNDYICVENEYYYPTLEIIDSIFYSFGPFALMFLINFAIAFRFMRAKCNQRNSTESTNQSLVKSATRGTAMVVTVSITFLLLTAPTGVGDVLGLPSIPLYRAFMNLTQYLNHSIDGVLYCIVGSRFRRELLNLFIRKERCQDISASHSVNTTSLTSISGGRT